MRVKNVEFFYILIPISAIVGIAEYIHDRMYFKIKEKIIYAVCTIAMLSLCVYKILYAGETDDYLRYASIYILAICSANSVYILKRNREIK